jgi:hypothetical protein
MGRIDQMDMKATGTGTDPGAMTVRTADPRDLDRLREALDRLDGVRVSAAVPPGLTVHCAGPAAVGRVARAVRVWVGDHGTGVTAWIEGHTVPVTSTDADTMIPRLLMLLLAAERRARTGADLV